MDYRILRNAIMTSVCVIIIVLTAVLLGNWQQITGGNSQGNNGQSSNGQSSNGQSSNAQSNNGDGSRFVLPGQVEGADLSAFKEDRYFFDEAGGRESNVLISYGSAVSGNQYEGNYVSSNNNDGDVAVSGNNAKGNNALGNDTQKTADLIMSSAEKDLTIHIVDDRGRNITGEEFRVSVAGIGDYRDSDRDGVIYIKPIATGERLVTLNGHPGYRTPAKALPIVIKQQIEYVAISARDLKILTEDEIDESIEDSANKTAEADRDQTEQTQLPGSWDGAKTGIDVSKWNKEIDWDKVKSAGVEFAIIRLGYRGYTSGVLVIDPYFEQNIQGAAAAGIPVGVYFFSQAVNAVEAVEEASMVIELCKDYQLSYPAFIDSESSGGRGRADNLSAETRTDVSRAFMETIQSGGLAAGIYSGRNWFGQRLQMERLDGYIVWLAEYREAPLYQGYYQLWQYSSKGHIDGIEGYVDLNLSYID